MKIDTCALCSERIAPGDLILDNVRFTVKTGLFNGQYLRMPKIQTYLFDHEENRISHASCLKNRLSGLVFNEPNTQIDRQAFINTDILEEIFNVDS